MSLIHQNDELRAALENAGGHADFETVGADEPIPFELAPEHEPIPYSVNDWAVADPFEWTTTVGEPPVDADWAYLAPEGGLIASGSTRLHERLEAYNATLAEASEPLALEARKFNHGDVIPDDVLKVQLARDIDSEGLPEIAERKGNGAFGYAWENFEGKGWGPSDTTRGAWEPADFPLTVVAVKEPEQLLTLRETAELLSRQGANTGHHRLRRYLNEGIAWTDAYNEPRAGALGKYLVMTDKPNASRGAVVRVTPRRRQRAFGRVGCFEVMGIPTAPAHPKSLEEQATDILRAAGYVEPPVSRDALGRANFYPSAHDVDRRVNGKPPQYRGPREIFRGRAIAVADA
ncbi:hypothetical protein CH253_08385 [Rhodococcus sp. 06-156-3C]|uniref:hypothetical protein n=1 Tax=Rhodococcus sp. 06-156-3C TaxID=2022486 RepID=UPI000B9C5409|nr:hypothetical protein [Rhodococcus sp. 06-156-3C]OZD23864.1 hypothetical protein CH253_08385 [Rhodococcus sp. 06-156-3C]